jgi:hypothetical protein
MLHEQVLSWYLGMGAAQLQVWGTRQQARTLNIGLIVNQISEYVDRDAYYTQRE